MECFDPTVSQMLTLEAKQYLLNHKKYLKDFSEWDEQIRDWLASQEGIDLTPEHLHTVVFLRNSFSNNRLHPVIRKITEELAKKFGKEKGTIKYFHELFPGGIHQAYLIAGLPMQDSCC
ncbi:TusE/DsrC/DsvC family sulfur relay protein [Desulfopila sp. IMCC35006]|uniref:TusE/DsrC/DsvC family sulfur relay protein n=1 Tax=Desulfopila sp. IMCC35006 TaxID=2569542 RepID=UPI0010ABD8D3|nr:TusE/DsrC/DsvC family sulfur relay protein [Desulfopila sp. IMCC35006]TKB23741.1 TusE/DsrC/DsvC family sulfur relay protein [Desulfopila sp. IMCC35006]